MYKNFCLLLIILICLLSFISNAQIPFFRKIDLPGTNVDTRIHSLCQDSRNLVWVGTSDGIFRFNGLNFESFPLPDSVKDHRITAIAKYHNSGIIAGTSGGKIFSIINDKVLIYSTDTFVVNTSISSIASFNKNDFWVSTHGQGIFQFINGNVFQYSQNDGLGDDYVYDLVFDDTGRLWVGSDGGLSFSDVVNNKLVFKNLNSSNGLPDNIVRKLIKGPGNTIGLGTEDAGFSMYDYSSQKFTHPPYFQNRDNEPVYSMVLLESEFWVGTLKTGIIDYEFKGKRRVRQLPLNENIPTADINCMLKDHDGNVWVGSVNELYFSPGEKFEYKYNIDDFYIGNVRAILNDSKGLLWISNETGLHCYNASADADPVIFEPLLNTKFNDYVVISLYEDDHGFIWMGTFDHGVIRYDKQTGQSILFNESNGLINLNVLSIDGSGNEIWFATLGGVSRCAIFDSTLNGVSGFSGFSDEDGLGNNFIYSVFVDSRNRVWFGTDGVGVTCYSNSKFINYSEQQGLESKVIYSITEDHQGNIWMSSANDGLIMFNGNEFRKFTTTDGLGDLNISSVATSNLGHLVIIHQKGIDILDPLNFQFVSYGSEVGLSDIDPDLNVVDVNYGDVWVGVKNGIVKLSFDTTFRTSMPVVILNEVLCFLEKVDTTTGNQFTHNRNHISFSFFAVWYTDPMRVVYQYRLNGYGNDWITTRDRLVTFPNLQPGNYTFLVRSSINGNFTGSVPVSYEFTINTPFWKQLWFIILCIVALIGMIYIYLKFREKQIKAVEMLNRERIESQFEVLKNQVNPHFLFNSFNTLITVIENDKDIAVEYVNKLSDFFRSILSYREMDLITLNDELVLVESYIFLQQKRYGNNFKVTIHIPASLRSQYMIPPLSLQILIENCLKHNAVSSESPLMVDIEIEPGLYIEIRNNINLTFVKEPSTGIGLQNLRNRYRIITGKEIDVSEMDGIFTVRLPLIKYIA